jgi:hypothetical protein
MDLDQNPLSETQSSRGLFSVSNFRIAGWALATTLAAFSLYLTTQSETQRERVIGSTPHHYFHSH